MGQRQFSWADVTGILRWAGPHHRRLLAVAALLALAGGGYVGLTSAGASSPRGHSRGGGAARVTSSSPAGPSAAAVGGGTSGTTGTSGSGAFACPMIPAGTNMTGGTDGVGSATHLFTRTTADGVTIRAYRLSSIGTTCGCGPIPTPTSPPTGTSSASTGPATAVLPTGELSLEMSDATAVGDGVLDDTSSLPTTTTNAVTEPSAVTANAFGVAEGAPVWWVAVSVGPDVANVQMMFSDGSTDQMSPVDGVAALAHQIDPSLASSGDGPYAVRGTLRLLDSSGAVVGTVTFPQPILPPDPPAGTPPPTTVAPTTVAPTPTPLPDPVSPPQTVPGSTPTTSVATGSPAPIPDGSAIVCSEVAAPSSAQAG